MDKKQFIFINELINSDTRVQFNNIMVPVTYADMLLMYSANPHKNNTYMNFILKNIDLELIRDFVLFNDLPLKNILLASTINEAGLMSGPEHCMKSIAMSCEPILNFAKDVVKDYLRTTGVSDKYINALEIDFLKSSYFLRDCSNDDLYKFKAEHALGESLLSSSDIFGLIIPMGDFQIKLNYANQSR